MEQSVLAMNWQPKILKNLIVHQINYTLATVILNMDFAYE